MDETARRSFEFMAGGRVVFGRGSLARVAELALPLGGRALVVTGQSALSSIHASVAADRGATQAPEDEAPGSPRSTWGFLQEQLSARGVSAVHLLVRGEPSVEFADEGARLAGASRCDFVIGLGGGSVLDSAKAISGLMTNGGDALDYLEIVGRGRTLESPAAPLIAIPTTAGTGSEVTRNAVLTEPRARVKVSMRSPHLQPALAVVDPELTRSLSPQLTASTGLDALTQLIEAYITPRANPVTDLYALEGIRRSVRSLLRAVRHPDDPDAREDLALASLFGGFALANAGLGAVHGIAAPLGGRHPVPHGVACAVLLPHVLETNLRALRREDPTGAALVRIARIGEVLRESSRSAEGELPEVASEVPADAALELLRRIVLECRLPGLASFGIAPSDITPIVEGAMRASSMRGNPITLTAQEIGSAITAAL